MALAAALPRRTVLIVEDNEDIRTSLAMLLQLQGYATAEADNGQSALTMLHRDTVNPCLILLDLNMPVMDGIEFRQRQRADPALSRIPVVIYSGSDNVRSTARDLDVPHYFKSR